MVAIYFNSKKKKYYYVVNKHEKANCSICNEEIGINQSIIIHISASKLQKQKFLYCALCVGKHTKKAYDSFMTATVLDYVPNNCIIVNDILPELRICQNTNVFFAAYSNEGINADTTDTAIVDRCVLAHRKYNMIMPEYQTAKLEWEKLKAKDIERNKHIENESMLDKELLAIKTAIIEPRVISYKDKKLIGVK